jgi:hypothetical protein
MLTARANLQSRPSVITLPLIPAASSMPAEISTAPFPLWTRAFIAGRQRLLSVKHCGNWFYVFAHAFSRGD